MATWLMIGLAALATYGTRALFGVLPARWQLPQRMQEALEFLPPSAFAALALPGLLRADAPVPTFVGSRVLAAIVAAYVAWLTRSFLLTCLAGLVVYGLDLWVS